MCQSSRWLRKSHVSFLIPGRFCVRVGYFEISYKNRAQLRKSQHSQLIFGWMSILTPLYKKLVRKKHISYKVSVSPPRSIIMANNARRERGQQRISQLMLKSERAAKDAGNKITKAVNATEEEEKDSEKAQAVRLPRSNPFEAPVDEVLDLSVPGGKLNFEESEVRFASNKTVGVGNIKIDVKKSQFGVSSYDGWFIKSYSLGEDPDWR